MMFASVRTVPLGQKMTVLLVVTIMCSELRSMRRMMAVTDLAVFTMMLMIAAMLAMMMQVCLQIWGQNEVQVSLTKFK